MFDFFTILHDNGLLLLMGQYPNGPLGGVLCTSTLGYVINVPELTYAANQVSNQLLTKPFQVFAIVALSYYLINFSLTWLANRLEIRIAAKRRRAQSATGNLVPPLVLSKSPSQSQ
ncbi:hypothetical protein DZA65_03845 [Dickeya dianthicola]|nr:hypothetical protein [Dickeya dianthicola]AYC20694.1 hypothetical protein DZA65_03845 [Dickeya dianthicola]MBI0439679.1 hypothetical protein [Dickeya dianthicola]MBI0450185.1 hypothetical protein [Dickeya dianthicola]MBI0454732.1 hypothetical protein [Dickeya dianthicola]MBI0459516.1 hypothetical protein [Dickeya dianthicola]